MSDIEIARKANMSPINEILEKLNVPDTPDAFSPMGRHIAKINLKYINSLKDKKDGKLVLVTAITPTPAGEGKTTTSVGLSDGLNKIGKKSIVCLREPSLGPSFGMKGGAAGGGYAQVVPMEQINLHFTGDFHAITSAHNLLSAAIDNHIYWGNKLQLDIRRITWKRIIDMNDRALRKIITSLGGVSNGYLAESGFDIVAASEIMAILCLSSDLEDLQIRLEKIVIGYTKDKTPITCKDLKVAGSMATLLKDAIKPNLVQTIENTPVFVHGGPFANIAHGCNSVIATKLALKLSDYVVTEAGFGSDLGAEKFMNIKCTSANISPDMVVIVATVRALKMSGGIDKKSLDQKNIKALIDGCQNLKRHIENLKIFNVPVLVAINHFHKDTDDEIRAIQKFTKELNVEAILCKHWEKGSEGIKELSNEIIHTLDSYSSSFSPLYSKNLPLVKKINTIVKSIYRADGIEISDKLKNQLLEWEKNGYGSLPICMAKTQYSFTSDPKIIGAPKDFKIPIREVRLLAGAGFIVVVCGDMMTMPGLPKNPAAESISIDKNGEIVGLF